MTNLARYLTAAALLATLVACGNKGPLVRPSAVKPPVQILVPPAIDPTDTAPVEETAPPPTTGPSTPTPPATPPAGGGNG